MFKIIPVFLSKIILYFDNKAEKKRKRHSSNIEWAEGTNIVELLSGQLVHKDGTFATDEEIKSQLFKQ